MLVDDLVHDRRQAGGAGLRIHAVHARLLRRPISLRGATIDALVRLRGQIALAAHHITSSTDRVALLPTTSGDAVADATSVQATCFGSSKHADGEVPEQESAVLADGAEAVVSLIAAPRIEFDVFDPALVADAPSHECLVFWDFGK